MAKRRTEYLYRIVDDNGGIRHGIFVSDRAVRMWNAAENRRLRKLGFDSLCWTIVEIERIREI